MRRVTTSVLALVLLLSLSGLVLAQTTPIDDIQYYDPATGAPASPYAGQTVTVEGVIYVVKGTYNSGTHYIQGATGGINFFDSAAQPLTYGDRIQVTGTVGSYGGEINISSPTIVFLGSGAEPAPIVTDIQTILHGDPLDTTDDYEMVGNFVRVTGTVATKSYNNFTITDFTDTLEVYIDSDTGIDLGAVDVGDVYQVDGPCVVYNGTIELKPRRQSDLVENPGGDTLPVIQDVDAANWVPEASDPITITATITDDDAITSAVLYYRDDTGDSTGVFTSVAMTNIGGDTWSGTIPAGHTGRQVDFYVEATDTGSQTVTNPGDAPAGWYEVAIGFTPIHDIQWAHPDSVYQGSSYRDKVTNIHGIVTVGTGDAGSISKFILADGEGAWNAILVYEGTAANYVLPGDEVAIGGYIDEYYGLTEMQPHNGGAVYLLSFGNDLPEPPKVHTRVLADNSLDDGNGKLGEAYESVVVTTFASAVLDTTGAAAWNTFKVSDTGAWADSMVVDAMIDLAYAPQVGDVLHLTGFMNYAGQFELVPRSDTDIVLTGATAIDEPLPQLLPAGGFTAIAPNPFNPKTQIRFVLTRDNLAQLNIYNLRGELVRSLVNGRLAGGQEYVFQWDGTDAHGQHVASGTYFARLRIGTEVLQVRKLQLVK